jgi:hypothetical protein
MNVFRFPFTVAVAMLALAAPLSAQTAPNTTGWTWWSAATPDQKQLVVRGELDAIPTGFYEPVIIVGLTQALTGNAAARGIEDNLVKAVPKFSKTPAQYVTLIDGVYTKPAFHQLTVSRVLACLADVPFGAANGARDECLKSWNNS